MRIATRLAFAVVLVASGGCHNSTSTEVNPGFPSFSQPLQCTNAADVPTLATPTNPPPAISGGTMLVTADGKFAVAADSDRDQVSVIDANGYALIGTVALNHGDEPGRVIQDGAGRVYVALRRGGAVVAIDPATAKQVARYAACPAPRGLAFDSLSNSIFVACAGGELTTLPLDGKTAATTVMVEPDLRDVVVQNGQLLISEFRSASLLTVDRSGHILARTKPAEFQAPDIRAGAKFTPSVAWRTIGFDGGALMLHQRGTTNTIVTNPDVAAIGGPIANDPGGPIGGGGGGGDSYGGGGGTPPPPGVMGEGGSFSFCSNAIVHATVSIMNGPTSAPLGVIPGGVVVTDVAMSPDNTQLAIAVTGNTSTSSSGVMIMNLVDLQSNPGTSCLPFFSTGTAGAQPVAIAWRNKDLMVQTRNPATVLLTTSFLDGTGGSSGPTPIQVTLATDNKFDQGHELFHGDSGGGIACASCHPEGGDDGRTWTFDFGSRRTVALRGGILGSEPFHWNGDLSTMMDLTNEVFVRRMGGAPPDCQSIAALSTWVDTLQTLPHAAPADPAAVARGASLFHDPTVACASCHTGSLLTNNTTIDVGGGLPLQVPRLLGLADRAPYLHDGCAATLTDRFGVCGSDQHGHTSQLSSAQVSDLVAFLNTL